ncbi:MAG: hypothetical protein Q7U74_08175 [Saprospiraceae bacterium]|nr:hypothetical protein [Saprospiraceae bacterium]
MKIDFKKTAERIRVLNLSEVARQLHVSKQLVWRVATGGYWAPGSVKSEMVLAKLRELGMLVEVPDDVDLAT